MTQPKLIKNRISKKANSFTESVIREMTREALKLGRDAKLSDGLRFVIIYKSRLSIFIEC